MASDGAGGRADGDGERIGDRVVDRDELELERAELLVLALLDGEAVRPDAVLLELRLGERERQARADDRDVLLELEQVGNGADVVLVSVREHDADDVVEPALDRLEVGQDQVDARLVLLGEEHAAVDDEELAAVLEDGHVAADLAEAAERRHAERAGFEGGRVVYGAGHQSPSCGSRGWRVCAR